MKDEIKKMLIEKYSVVYNLYSDVTIKIVSNTERGLMKEYFSTDAISEKSLEHSVNYTIYIIDKFLDEIDVSVLNACKNSTLRSKRIYNGYYNLHHFGKGVGLYHESNSSVFYVFGEYKFSKKVVWSYLIKWIITESCLKNKVHLKASCLSINGKGYLILGDKLSGKSTLVNALMKEIDNVCFVSNTHVIVDECNAYGVKSKINFRKDVAKKIQQEYNILKDVEIKSCTNIDPILLNYTIREKCKINTIIFYQFSDISECEIKRVNIEDMLCLLNLYSDGISFYTLQNDLMNFYGGDIDEIISLCQYNDNLKRSMLANAEKFIISANESSFNRVVEFIKGRAGEK